MGIRSAGTVVAFDERRGLGEVEAHEVDRGEGEPGDGRRYPFHCTAIADGTRRIPIGVEVDFDVVAGPLGTAEAAAVRRR